MIKNVAIAFAALTLAQPASADPDRISLLLGSKHFGSSGYNENNPGLFATWEKENVHLSLGAFHNSFSKPSIAATAYIPMLEWDNGNAGPFVGLAYYPEDGRRHPINIGDVIPLAGLQARQKNLFIQLTPMDGKPVDALISFGLTLNLKKGKAAQQ